MKRRVLVLLLAALTVWPTTAVPAVAAVDGHVVETLPPVSGVRLQYDGVVYTTDEQGSARITTSDPRIDADRLRVLDTDVKLGKRRRAEVGRIYVVGGQVTVTWNTERRVTLGFRDLEGGDVANTDVDSVRLKSSLGDSFEVEPTEAKWLLSQRVVRNFQELTVKDILWTVEDAKVAGASVVNRSQQRFFPANDKHFSIELLFYTAAFAVKDAFFGVPRGDALRVEHPNGEVEEVPIDGGGKVTLENLPRGDYVVTVLGSGLELERPVAVSRRQDMDLAFYSWLDVGLFFASLAAFAVGLLLIGVVLRRRQRARPASAAAPGQQLVNEEVAR